MGSEIIPKTLGATHWRKLAPISAIIVNILQICLSPFIRLLMLMTDKFTHSTASERSRAEVESTVRHASGSAMVTDMERRILANVLALKKMLIKEIMTPRVVVFCVSEDMTVDEYRAEHIESSFSRIPLFKGDIDKMSGYVLRSDILKSEAGATKLRELKRELPIFPETLDIRSLMERLAESDQHIALVVDEYGN